MKKILLIALIIVSHHLVYAQAGEWTWMNGDSIPNSIGNYGTQGVPNSLNNPPGVYEPAWWTDLDGNFWLLGGIEYSTAYATALWKYDRSNNLWTWMKGPSTTGMAGVYGTMGIASPGNYPGSRCGGVATWTDTTGNLWMFGGFGYDVNGISAALSDVWKYDLLTNEWTWMSGSEYVGTNAFFGTYQSFGDSVTPGDHVESTCTWKDANDNFWIYGGGGFGNSSAMFKYDYSINEWAWIWGGNGFTSINYGVQGIPSASNSPGSRATYAHWKDGQGRMWLSGGWYVFGGFCSDMWMYDPIINEWAWMAGSNLLNDVSPHGIKCDTSQSFFPASRHENSSCWTDMSGNFWVFGGSQNEYETNPCNDLWCFQTQSLRWIWANSDSVSQQQGHYGTQGISAATNVVPARTGAAAWLDCESNLWLYGGAMFASYSVSMFNDLWRFQIDPDCVPGFEAVSCNHIVSFVATNQSLCEKFCINFFDSSQNNPTSWLWQFPGGDPSSSTDQNPTNICYNAPGTYDVTLITTNASGNDTLTLHNYITVYPTPQFPTITQVGYTLTSSPANSYQWQLNSIDIPGATNQSYTILQSGYYTVIVEDSNSCKNSTTTYVLIDGVNDVHGDTNISIYPNPSSGNFIVEFPNDFNSDEISIDVVNVIGQKVFSSQQSRSIVTTSNWKKEIDLHDASSGVYFIEIKSSRWIGIVKKKIVVTR